MADPNNDLTVTRIGTSAAEAGGPIDPYSSVAAGAGQVIKNPENNYMTPGRTAQTQATPSQFTDVKFGSMTMGFSAKAVFSPELHNITGLNLIGSSGTNMLGPVEDSNGKPIIRGKNLNLAG